MWMSLICAMLKPCRPAGRSRIGTSTTTTAAVRRAFHSPISVIARAASATPAADHSATLCGLNAVGKTSSTRWASNRPRSRTTVSTTSDEHRPMNNKPAQLSSCASGFERTRRASRPQGISAADRISVTPSATCAQPRPASAGSRRQPT